MDAVSFTCPGCGAPATPEAASCAYCKTRLATVTCPGCLALVFSGSQHCFRCGGVLSAGEVTSADARSCPRCAVPLEASAVGDAYLDECPRCAGIWVDRESFGRICASKEEQATLTALGSPRHVTDAPLAGIEVVRYIPCPTCTRLMNRVNFAHCSGVVVDICKSHGVWFDQDELRRVVAFIRGGGLERARARELEAIAEERHRLVAVQQSLQAMEARDLQARAPAQGSLAVDVARGVLDWLVGG